MKTNPAADIFFESAVELPCQETVLLGDRSYKCRNVPGKENLKFVEGIVDYFIIDMLAAAQVGREGNHFRWQVLAKQDEKITPEILAEARTLFDMDNKNEMSYITYFIEIDGKPTFVGSAASRRQFFSDFRNPDLKYKSHFWSLHIRFLINAQLRSMGFGKPIYLDGTAFFQTVWGHAQFGCFNPSNDDKVKNLALTMTSRGYHVKSWRPARMIDEHGKTFELELMTLVYPKCFEYLRKCRYELDPALDPQYLEQVDAIFECIEYGLTDEMALNLKSVISSDPHSLEKFKQLPLYSFIYDFISMLNAYNFLLSSR